jgi:DNA-directed RNA polymerase
MTTKTWWLNCPNEQLVETAWERQMNMAGIERFENLHYNANGKAKDVSDMAVGHKTVRKMLKVGGDAVEKLQNDLVLMAKVNRIRRAAVLAMDHDTLALIGIRALLDSTYDTLEPDRGTNWQNICKNVGKSVENELSFQSILRQSKAEARQWAQASGKPVPTSFAEKMLEKNKNVDKFVKRWKKTLDDVETYVWDTETQLYVGEAIIQTLVLALPESFEKGLVPEGGFLKHYVRMTDECRSKINQIEEQITKMQVIRKPMIRKPRAWTCEEQ